MIQFKGVNDTCFASVLLIIYLAFDLHFSLIIEFRPDVPSILDFRPGFPINIGYSKL